MTNNDSPKEPARPKKSKKPRVKLDSLPETISEPAEPKPNGQIVNDQALPTIPDDQPIPRNRALVDPIDADAIVAAMVKAEAQAGLDKQEQQKTEAPEKSEEESAEHRRQRIRELAQMDPLDYEDLREEEARDLRIGRISALDQAVERTRRQILREASVQREKAPPPGTGHWKVERWPDPVDGAELIQELVDYLDAHIWFRMKEQAIAVAGWIMMTYVFPELARRSPFLLLRSAIENEGKTNLLTLVSWLARMGYIIGGDSAAGTYQRIAQWKPTACVDEAKRSFRGEMLDILLKAYTKAAAKVEKGRPNAEGQRREFDIWTSWAFTVTQRPRDTQLQSRCIDIGLRRKPKGISKRAMPMLASDPKLKDLRSKLLRWSVDHIDDVKQAQAKIETGAAGIFENRRGDNWVLQTAICDVIGGEWPEKARQTAKVIGEEQAADEQPDLTRTIAAMSIILGATHKKTQSADKKTGRKATKEGGLKYASLVGRDKDPRIHSDTAIKILLGWGAPWSGWGTERQAQIKLSRVLENAVPPIRPQHNMRIGKVNGGGYRLSQFAEYVDAYCSDDWFPQFLAEHDNDDDGA
jgi:Protein of unknown function (DUF3631)